MDEEERNFDIVDLNEDNMVDLKFRFLSILQNQNTLKHQSAYYLQTDYGYLVKNEGILEPFWEKKENKQIQNFKNRKEQYFWYMYKMLVNKN